MYYNILDIGASGGKSKCLPVFTKNLNRLNFLFNYFGVEPNEDALSSIIGYKEVYNDAINLTNGPATLYITKDPYKTSLLKPNDSVVSDFMDYLDYEVTKEVIVNCITLEELIGCLNVEIDIIKLDIQGIEASVLAEYSGLDIPVVICEAASIEVYEGQTLSSTLLNRMASLDYGLLDITFKSNATHENDFIFIKNTLFNSNLLRVSLLRVLMYWYTGNWKLIRREIKSIIKNNVFQNHK
jgi:FkbM family methyltransferase